MLVHEDDHTFNKNTHSIKRKIYSEWTIDKDQNINYKALTNQVELAPNPKDTSENLPTTAPTETHVSKFDAEKFKSQQNYDKNHFSKNFLIQEISGFDIVKHDDIIPIEANLKYLNSNHAKFKSVRDDSTFWLNKYFKHKSVETFFSLHENQLHRELWKMDLPVGEMPEFEIEATPAVEDLKNAIRYSEEIIHVYKSDHPYDIKGEIFCLGHMIFHFFICMNQFLGNLKKYRSKIA